MKRLKYPPRPEDLAGAPLSWGRSRRAGPTYGRRLFMARHVLRNKETDNYGFCRVCRADMIREPREASRVAARKPEARPRWVHKDASAESQCIRLCTVLENQAKSERRPVHRGASSIINEIPWTGSVLQHDPAEPTLGFVEMDGHGLPSIYHCHYCMQRVVHWYHDDRRGPEIRESDPSAKPFMNSSGFIGIFHMTKEASDACLWLRSITKGARL